MEFLISRVPFSSIFISIWPRRYKERMTVRNPPRIVLNFPDIVKTKNEKVIANSSVLINMSDLLTDTVLSDILFSLV